MVRVPVDRVNHALVSFLFPYFTFMKKILSPLRTFGFFLFVGLFLTSCTSSGDYSNLTFCLAEKKVVMFGASWCPHCAEQKKMFD